MVLLISAVRPRRDDTMPYVNINVTEKGATAEQKKNRFGASHNGSILLWGKKSHTAYAVIDGVDTDSRGVDGETITAKRKRESNR